MHYLAPGEPATIALYGGAAVIVSYYIYYVLAAITQVADYLDIPVLVIKP